MTAQAFAVPDAAVEQYRCEGFAIFEGAVVGSQLALAREICARAVAWKEEQLKRTGATEDGISLLGRRYFVSGFRRRDPRLEQILFSETTAAICRALIGDTAYLHNEQFVVKLRDERSSFAWHQDSGYTVYEGGAEKHAPYLTCWLALDDMSEENGTISLLPYSRAGTRELMEHRWSDEANAMIGYEGDDPGDPVVVPVGTIVAFSSVTLHRSGCNSTDRPRRSYFMAYTPALFPHADRSKGDVYSPAAVPFLEEGRRVGLKMRAVAPGGGD